MCADFASLDGMGGNIPTNGASADRLQLTTPNSMITGTMAGLQQIGSPSLTVDSVKNLITVKPISTANTQILRYGQVATGFLGMAVNDGTNDNMFAGKDNSGNTVIKIAKSGFDVKTATNDQLVFNSNQDIFKIVKKVNSQTVQFNTTFNGSVTSGGATLILAHGLTFTPIVEVYAQAQIVNINNGLVIATTYAPLPFGTTNLASYYFPALNSGSSYPMSMVFAIDATNVYVNIYYNAGGDNHDTIAAIPLAIFYLQETAN